jgi:hypothetical protein
MKYPLLSIPIIRRVLPQNIASEILSVQSMTDASADIFKFRTVTQFDEDPPLEGTQLHKFGQGWFRRYNGEWIPDSVWWKLKIKGL